MTIVSAEAKERKRVKRRKYNAQPKNIRKRSENLKVGRKKGSSSTTVNDHKGAYGTKNPSTKKQSLKNSQKQGGNKISRNRKHMAMIGRKGGKA